MGQFLLLIAVVLTVGAVVFGITVLVTGEDQGLGAVEPDGRAVPLPANRPLVEEDVQQLRFDAAVRGYRMSQVDAALRRAAYDIGYKEELINVLEAEVAALRSGRFPDAEVLRRARDAAVAPLPPAEPAATGAVVVAGAEDTEAPAGDGPAQVEPEPAAAGAADGVSPDGPAAVDPAGAVATASGDAGEAGGEPDEADAVEAPTETAAVEAEVADTAPVEAEAADTAPTELAGDAPAVVSGKGRR
jgi:DivIVA domain-containing protein